MRISDWSSDVCSSDLVGDIRDARPLAVLGDSITTDHISPVGSIKADSPAGTYLQEHQVAKADFNSYGARRGNHEVMMRGTFANIRFRNAMTLGVEGGLTKHTPCGARMHIYDAAIKYTAVTRSESRWERVGKYGQ